MSEWGLEGSKHHFLIFKRAGYSKVSLEDTFNRKQKLEIIKIPSVDQIRIV